MALRAARLGQIIVATVKLLLTVRNNVATINYKQGTNMMLSEMISIVQVTVSLILATFHHPAQLLSPAI